MPYPSDLVKDVLFFSTYHRPQEWVGSLEYVADPSYTDSSLPSSPMVYVYPCFSEALTRSSTGSSVSL